MWTEASRVYDISVRLGVESADYPGDEPFRRKLTASFEAGDAYETSALTMSAHAGTHIDMPSHFIPGGGRIDDYGAGNFILTGQVVEIPDRSEMHPEMLTDLDIEAGDAILFKTSNSATGLSRSGVFRDDYVCISETIACWCVDRRMALVGIDSISADCYGNSNFPVHHILLEKGIFILEGIHLEEVPTGRYTLICLPLKIAAGEASLVRAVLIG